MCKQAKKWQTNTHAHTHTHTHTHTQTDYPTPAAHRENCGSIPVYSLLSVPSGRELEVDPKVAGEGRRTCCFRGCGILLTEPELEDDDKEAADTEREL